MAARLAVAALGLLSTVLLVSGLARAGGTIDLDRPGALEALDRSNLAHAAKVPHLRGDIVPLR